MKHAELNGIATMAVLAIIGVVGTVGNALVIVYFGWKMPKRISSTYRLFIVQLAVADLLCSLNAPLMGLMQSLQFLFTDWVFGEFLCKFSSLAWTLTGASAWLLCGIAFERYRAIVHPLGLRTSRKLIVSYSAWCLIFPVALTIPYIVALEVKNAACTYIHQDWYYRHIVVFLSFETLLKFICPTFIMYFFTISTMQTLKLKCAMFSEQVFGDERAKERQRLREKVAVKVLWRIVIAYTVCITPAHVVYVVGNIIYQYFWKKDFLIPSMYFNSWAFVLLYLNSVLNCFIYAGQFKDFNKFLRRICRRS